jgi:hypothetical protein
LILWPFQTPGSIQLQIELRRRKRRHIDSAAMKKFVETCHCQLPPPFPDNKNTREIATCSWDDREEGNNTGVPIENYFFAMDLSLRISAQQKYKNSR